MKVSSVNTLKQKALALGIGSVVATIFVFNIVKADEPVCYGQYGQIIPCPVVNKSFSIEKAVISGTNLVEEVRGVRNNNEVKFNLVVKNTGQLTTSVINVVDNLPSNLTFVGLSENGNPVSVLIDQNSVSWTVTNLAPNATRTYVMTTKANTNGIAQNEEKCVVNISNVYYTGIKESSNTATVCIKDGGEVLAERLPETDAFDNLVVALASIAVISGLLLYSISKIAEIKSVE